MYRIIISPKAKRELKLLTRLYRQAIKEAVEEMKDNPLIGKPLTRELTGRYSYRIGIYRILYKINKDDKVVNILSVGHRGSVYQ